MAESDDVVSIDLDTMIFVEECWKLILRPFVGGHRISDWTIHYGNGRAKAIVRSYGNESSFVQSLYRRARKHCPTSNNVAAAVEIQCWRIELVEKVSLCLD